MSETLEIRVGTLLREIKELKKDLILQKTAKLKTVKNKTIKWQALGTKVSNSWDNITAVEEIRMQREKF